MEQLFFLGGSSTVHSPCSAYLSRLGHCTRKVNFRKIVRVVQHSLLFNLFLKRGNPLCFIVQAPEPQIRLNRPSTQHSFRTQVTEFLKKKSGIGTCPALKSLANWRISPTFFIDNIPANCCSHNWNKKVGLKRTFLESACLRPHWLVWTSKVQSDENRTCGPLQK